MSPAACTVRYATTGACGKAAVWSDGSYAECVEHARGPISLAVSSTGRRPAGPRVGDVVEVRRYGKVYDGCVVDVRRSGAVYAEIALRNGRRRTVRV